MVSVAVVFVFVLFLATEITVFFSAPIYPSLSAFYFYYFI